MRAILFAAAATAAAALAGAAAADPAFDAFRALCLDSHGDYGAVVGAAGKADWKPVQVAVPAFNGVAVSDRATYGKAIGVADATLMVWRGKNASGVQVSECSVQASGEGFAGAQASAGTWAGFAPQDTTKEKATWRFTDPAGGPRKAVEPAEYDAAAAGSGMEILRISGGAQGVNFDLLRIKK